MATAAQKALNDAEMAQYYGFALSFLNSNSELKAIFQAAVRDGYSTDKFTAAVRNTKWYQQHSVDWRKADLLQKSDPATYNSLIAQWTAKLSDRAAQLGAPISWAQLQVIAGNALHLNWNDGQVDDVLGGYVKAVNGVYNGQTGNDLDSLKNTAWRNGVNLSDATLQSYATQMAKGSATRGFFERVIRGMAKTAAPGYADQLDAGVDLYTIADPYRQSMAKILELNPEDIDLFDPTIRGALTAVGTDGKPTSKSLWQFENDLRKDPRWLQTQNARDSGMSVAHRVLQDFGFSF